MFTAAALCLLAACSAKKEAARPLPPGVRVIQCTLAANREFVGVLFRMTGPERYDPEGMAAYLIDEATGEKYEVVRLQRIGRIAEFTTPGEKGVHHVLFRNREGKLKIGSYVTVVVGPGRQEHVLIGE
ncbi:MAG TPA: hypothetical protein VF853_06670 [Candidatus Deferrimicrobiaceae bacterium]